MQKKDAIGYIVRSAEKYQEYLLDKSMLLIFQSGRRSYNYEEVAFLKRNFAHLLGVEGAGITPDVLFDLAIAHKLDSDNFRIISDIDDKVRVSENLMQLPFTAKMIGVHNNSGNFLYTEKLAGNVSGCIGFRMDSDANCLLPNTLLRVDIREATREAYRIDAIYIKQIGDDLYPHEPASRAKYLVGKDLRWPDDISVKILPD